MVALTIVFAILVFLTVDLLVQRQALARTRHRTRAARRRARSYVGEQLSPITDVPGGFVLSRSHAWARPDTLGRWKVGSDPILPALLGMPDFVELVPPGTWLRRGEPLATIYRGERSLPVRSPVGGRVEESNVAVCDEPPTLRSDPYGAGWLCRIEPHASPDAHAGLHTGKDTEAFMAGEVQRLRDCLGLVTHNDAVGIAVADGGLPAPEFAEQLDDAAWRRLVDSFLKRDAGYES
jgi:glycine cleavage system H protein